VEKSNFRSFAVPKRFLDEKERREKKFSTFCPQLFLVFSTLFSKVKEREKPYGIRVFGVFHAIPKPYFYDDYLIYLSFLLSTASRKRESGRDLQF